MDVDGSSVPGEIDQNLLRQFSCMNTTDREELIGQMQRLLDCSYFTAKFCLDMSNWNLQAAVCCFLDFYSVTKLPNMSIQTASVGVLNVGPGASFEQTWTIANSGSEQWPGSCRLIQAGGEPLGATPYYVPPLPPGNSISVTLKFVAPTTPEVHKAYFQLFTDKGDQFGDTLWVTVRVECEMTMALVEQLAALPVPSSKMEESVTQTPSPSQEE